MPVVDFGMVALGRSLGQPRDVAVNAARYRMPPRLVEQLGFHTYHEAAEGETTTTLAARAARDALIRGGVEATEIDMLMVTSGTVPEYFNWDLSAAVARELGLRRTPTLLLYQACASAVLGFAQVAGVFATRDEIRTVLYVSTERVSEAHVRRLGGPTADSDGAVAVVLRRGHGELRWLATEEVRDSEYAHFFRVEYGGSAAPVPPAGVSNLTTNPAEQVYHHFRDDQEGFQTFLKACDDRLVEAVDGACARAGLARRSLSRVLLLHDNQPSMRDAADGLRIPIEQTNAETAAALGHFGGLDPLMSLAVYHERGDLVPGEILALAGMSAGMCWFCTLIEV
jgi:3-oxoacyl-[acyl-carrier-protein] synthase-3